MLMYVNLKNKFNVLYINNGFDFKYLSFIIVIVIFIYNYVIVIVFMIIKK